MKFFNAADKIIWTILLLIAGVHFTLFSNFNLGIDFVIMFIIGVISSLLMNSAIKEIKYD